MCEYNRTITIGGLPQWFDKLKSGSRLMCIWNEGLCSFGDIRTIEKIDETYIKFGKFDYYAIDKFRWRNYTLLED